MSLKANFMTPKDLVYFTMDKPLQVFSFSSPVAFFVCCCFVRLLRLCVLTFDGASCCRDYMDRFLNEQESGALPGTLPGRDRSASPINSLIYGDMKRNVPHLRQDLDEVSSTTTGPIDLLPISTATTTTLHTPGGTSSLHDIDSSQCVVGSSAATTCVAGGSKRAFEPDTSLDSSGAAGLRGSDLNGNTEDSEAAEPVCKKLKVDSSESGVCLEQHADSSSTSLPTASTKLLDSLPVTNITTSLDSITSTVLKASELSTSSESSWGQPAAGSVGL